MRRVGSGVYIVCFKAAAWPPRSLRLVCWSDSFRRAVGTTIHAAGVTRGFGAWFESPALDLVAVGIGHYRCRGMISAWSAFQNGGGPNWRQSKRWPDPVPVRCTARITLRASWIRGRRRILTFGPKILPTLFWRRTGRWDAGPMVHFSESYLAGNMMNSTNAFLWKSLFRTGVKLSERNVIYTMNDVG
jgi:hypothetical protein